jgi:ABC transporter substrate binding protein
MQSRKIKTIFGDGKRAAVNDFVCRGTAAEKNTANRVFVGALTYLRGYASGNHSFGSAGTWLRGRPGHFHEYRYSEGKPDRAPQLAAELVRLKVDLIVVAGGDAWIEAARNATKTIPIVMVGGGLDPVEAGHVNSLARSGGNVTGLTILNTELRRKRLELLKETVPRLLRVAVLYKPDLPSNLSELKEFRTLRIDRI